MDRKTVGDLARKQHALVTFDQLLELGMPSHRARDFVSDGFLERVHLGVLRVRGAPTTYEQRLLAACLAIGPEASASHRAAATVHDLLRYREPPVEVTTIRLRSPELSGVVVHRLADLKPRWVDTKLGVPVTTVARTLVDLGAVAGPKTVEAALDRAAGRKLVTYRDVRDAMVAVARKGRTGVGVIRRLLDARIGESFPPGVLEARMQTLLRNAGLPSAEPQLLVTDEHGGFLAIVDFGFPRQRVVVEVDGFEFHSSPRAIHDRNVRDRLLMDAKWVPLHFSWAEVEHKPHPVATEIGRHLRSQARLLGTMKDLASK